MSGSPTSPHVPEMLTWSTLWISLHRVLFTVVKSLERKEMKRKSACYLVLIERIFFGRPDTSRIPLYEGVESSGLYADLVSWEADVETGLMGG